MHSWAARYALRFFDAYLKRDAAALVFMNNTPAANGAPPHTMLTDVRRNGGKSAPTLENFVARLGTDGFDKAVPLYAQFAAERGAFTLGPNEIYGWASQLDALDRPTEAREIFRLGAHLHPNESGMFDGLGEMQAKTGQPEAAVLSYGRLLELDPEHADAKAYLQQHGLKPPEGKAGG